jgi:hypothetical protein
MTRSLYRELRIDATAGLHISHPMEVSLTPMASMIPVKSFRRLILPGAAEVLESRKREEGGIKGITYLITLNKSARDMLK